MEAKPEIDDYKYKDLVKKYIDIQIRQGFPLEKIIKKELNIERDPNKSDTKEIRSKLSKGFYILRKGLEDLINKCQVNLTPLDQDSILDLIRKYDTDMPLDMPGLYWACKAVITILKKGEDIALKEKKVSFTDLLWLPNIWNIPIYRKVNWVIGDEAQDSSKAIIGLYDKFQKMGARVILFADPRQAIMGFAGSDIYSWSTIREVFNPHQLPLSYCYRCPQSHLELAKKIVPHIKSSPNAEQGVLKVKCIDDCIRQAMASDLVICRWNDTLVRTCLNMLSKGKKAFIRGKDLQAKLSGILERITSPSSELETLQENLDSYHKTEVNKLNQEENKLAIQLLSEKVNALKACLDCFIPISDSIEELYILINDLFKDKDNSVVLSTIHRAKGDEADVVWLLDSDDLPFLKYARQDWEIGQEINITYVSLTRAKQCLYLVPNNRYNDKFGGIDFTTIAQYKSLLSL
jgi:hypothetical protein